LLPGLDLGDSASFQTAVGYLTLTPRQAYPLYYALGNVFAWIFPSEPAWAANLASAVYGAAAVAVCALIAARLAESRVAGAAAALFLAFSYTFWTQAVTAEVYTLHLLLTGLCLMMLLRWAEQPTTARLATFYAVYALSFGNHLSMILWLPAFTIFLLVYRTFQAAGLAGIRRHSAGHAAADNDYRMRDFAAKWRKFRPLLPADGIQPGGDAVMNYGHARNTSVARGAHCAQCARRAHRCSLTAGFLHL
jgi:hypothetical protein